VLGRSVELGEVTCKPQLYWDSRRCNRIIAADDVVHLSPGWWFIASVHSQECQDAPDWRRSTVHGTPPRSTRAAESRRGVGAAASPRWLSLPLVAEQPHFLAPFAREEVDAVDEANPVQNHRNG
jgi:hypothetical protein